MTLSLLIVWIICSASFTLFGSWYARKYNKADLLIALYITFVIISQILAAKISDFDLGFRTFFVPSGIIVFSVTYLLADIVNERFGRTETLKMIYIALVSQIAMVIFLWLGVQLEPASFWTLQSSWQQIFGLIPRITLGSWIAFIVSESVDAYIYSWFKKLTHGKHLWARYVFSTIPTLLLDSLIFIPIAFYGTQPIMPLIIGQTTIKWLVGLINIFFIYLNKIILGQNIFTSNEASQSATT